MIRVFFGDAGWLDVKKTKTYKITNQNTKTTKIFYKNMKGKDITKRKTKTTTAVAISNKFKKIKCVNLKFALCFIRETQDDNS